MHIIIFKYRLCTISQKRSKYAKIEEVYVPCLLSISEYREFWICDALLTNFHEINQTFFLRRKQVFKGHLNP